VRITPVFPFEMLEILVSSSPLKHLFPRIRLSAELEQLHKVVDGQHELHDTQDVSELQGAPAGWVVLEEDQATHDRVEHPSFHLLRAFALLQLHGGRRGLSGAGGLLEEKSADVLLL